VGNELHGLTLAAADLRKSLSQQPGCAGKLPPRKFPFVLQAFNDCTHKKAPNQPLNFTMEINKAPVFQA
jgi:hypothetical protein